MKKLFFLFGLMAGLVSLNAQTLSQSFLFDFGPVATTPTNNGDITPSPDANGKYWNNIASGTGSNSIAAGVAFTALVNTANTASTYALTTTVAGFVPNGLQNGGLRTPYASQFTAGGSDTDLAIATATEDFWYATSATSPAFKITGLNPAKRYKFKIFGSRTGDIVKTSRYTIVGAASTVGTLNSSNTAASLSYGTVYSLATGYNANSNNGYQLTSGGSYTTSTAYTGNNRYTYVTDYITPLNVSGSGQFTLTLTDASPTAQNTFLNCMKMEEYKGTQTISFATLTSKAVGDADYAPGATASSGLAVRYESSSPSVAIIVDGKIQIVGVGNTTITAFQDGDATYEAATSVPQTLNVSASLTAQTITFGALSAKTTGDAPFDLTATATSGLTVSYSSSNTAVATISGSTVTIVGGGTTDITASQAGNSTYSAAPNVIQTLTVNKQNQTITFGALSSKTDADAPFTVSPSSTSGLAVTLTSSNTDVALVSGSTITIVGSGTSTITASQAGNTIYNAATSIPQTLTVSSVLSVNQSFLFDFGPVTGSAGDITSSPDAKGNYWNNITGPAANASVSGLVNTANTASTYALTTTVGFTAAGLSNGGLRTPYASQFTAGGSDTDLAIGTATEDFWFGSSTSNSAFKITGLNPAKRYKFKIFASRAGVILKTTIYTIVGAATTIGTLNASNTAASLSYGTVYSLTTGYNILSNNGYKLTDTDPLYTLSTVYTGNNSNTYVTGLINPLDVSGSGQFTLTLTDASPAAQNTFINCMKIEEYATAQTITFGALSTKNYGDADFAPGASASSSLSVHYTSSNTSVATIVSDQIHIVGAGTSTITASQAGDTNYSPATNVSQTLTVNTKSLTAISSATASDKVYDGSTAAVITGTFTGIVEGDAVNLSGTFADANIGSGKTVTASSTLGGAQAAKYIFTGTLPSGLTASITAASASSTGGNISASGISETDLLNTNLTVSSGELVINQASTIHALTVAPGAKLTLNLNQSLSVVGALTLQSDATLGTATFIDNGGTISTGTATVQQYLTAGRNWYISSPVNAATAAVFNPAGGSNKLYWYDETKGSVVLPETPWTAISLNTTGLTATQGYVANMAADGVVSFSGTLNTGSLPTTTINRSDIPTNAGFNLVGNPYPSYLDWDQVSAASTHLLTTIWQRTKTIDNTTYQFDTYNNLGKMYISNSGKTVNSHIPPMQAFWVRVDNGYNSGTLNFTNAMRSHKGSQNTGTVETPNVINDPIFKSKATNAVSQTILRLQVSNGSNTDETVVYSNPDALNSYDNFDSPKMFNNSTSIAEIYTQAGSEQLAINGLNAIPYDTEMPLGFKTLVAGNFSIKASQVASFESGTKVILKDYADPTYPIVADLTDGSSYLFSSAASNNTSRFTLLFRSPSVVTGINPETNNNVWISIRNGQIVINGTSNGGMFDVFNAIGQRIISKNLTGTTVQQNIDLPGVYLVKITNEGKSITRKIIVD